MWIQDFFTVSIADWVFQLTAYQTLSVCLQMKRKKELINTHCILFRNKCPCFVYHILNFTICQSLNLFVALKSVRTFPPTYWLNYHEAKDNHLIVWMYSFSDSLFETCTLVGWLVGWFVGMCVCVSVDLDVPRSV